VFGRDTRRKEGKDQRGTTLTLRHQFLSLGGEGVEDVAGRRKRKLPYAFTLTQRGHTKKEVSRASPTFRCTKSIDTKIEKEDAVNRQPLYTPKKRGEEERFTYSK